jgi:tetratricopeptide (TPR) repeat protein
MRKFPGVSELHLQLGQFYAVEEDFVQARQSLARAVKADCVNAQAHYHLGLTCAAMGEYADAAKSLQRAFQLRPEDLLLAYQLTLAVRAAGSKGTSITIQLPESKPVFVEGSQIRYLANYLCREPEVVEAYLSLPESEEDSIIFGLVAGILQTAIDEHPNYADLHYYLSEVYARLGKKELALSEAQTALKLNPRYVQALVHMGKLCAKEGHRSKAIHYLQQAISCGGDFADVHCMVGELMQQIHRVEQARRHLKRALALNSNYTRAAEVLNALAA